MTEAQLPNSVTSASRRVPEIDALRLVSILGVVAIHVFGLVFINDALRGTVGWKIAAIIHIGSMWAVPAFIMLSGYLNLRDSSHENGPIAFYRKRLGTILIPMVFWQIFYVVVVRYWLNHNAIRPIALMQNILDGKVYTALYFFWIILGSISSLPCFTPSSQLAAIEEVCT